VVSCPNCGSALAADAKFCAVCGKAITPAQQKRFFTIATNAGWGKDELKTWLLTQYAIEHSKDIPRDRYDEICTRLEHDAEPPC
jgi:predicted amidophosphoribosyltransferase